MAAQGDLTRGPAAGVVEAPVEWRSVVREAASRLKALPGTVEADYLSLGEHLQDFYARTQRISQGSAKVASQMSGETATRAISGLQYVLEQAGSLGDSPRHSVTTLESILDRLVRTRSSLAAFTNITRHLYSLCNMIRIETARLGGAAGGFTTLSTDVTQLVKRIEDKSTVLADHTDALVRLIRSSFQRVAGLESQQKGRVRSILEGTLRNLDEMKRRQAASARIMQDLSEQWTAISNDIGQIVFSLQSHDITRQQLEHVVRVLETLVEETVQTSESETLLVVQACTLQQAQLENAGTEAIQAGDHIVESLRHLARTVRTISKKTREATRSEDQRDGSFMAELEKELLSIVRAVTDYERLNDSLYETLEQVAEPVRRMSDFLREISEIGIALRMLGLNACVHAARVGDGGVALSVLAESIHRVAADTSENILAVTSHLEGVVDLAAEIGNRRGLEADQGTQETSSVRERLETLSADLSGATRESALLLTEIDGEGVGLSKALGDAAEGVNAHLGLGQGIEEVLWNLDDLLQALSGIVPDRALTDEERGRLDRFLGSYTMRSERVIHQAVVTSPKAGGAGKAPSGPLASGEGAGLAGTDEWDGVDLFGDEPAAPAGPGLGDNVELFGDAPSAPQDHDLGDNVELFGDAPSAPQDHDLGDNVELF